MRIFYSLLFLLTIVFGDVVSSSDYNLEHDIVLMDFNGEGESESETELELEVKKEAKLQTVSGFHIKFNTNASSKHLIDSIYAYHLSPLLEIFSPPPEL